MTTCYDSIDPLYNNPFSFTLNRKSYDSTSTKTSTIELMVQQVNLPGITIPDQPQPTILGTTIPIPTMMVTFEPLNIEFIVDSNLTNWQSIFTWMRQMTNIENDYEHNLDYQNWHINTGTLKIYKQNTKYPTQDTTACSDLVLSTIQFYNLIPIALSGLKFQSDSTDLIIQKATCRFKYSYYTMDPIVDDVNFPPSPI